jgi:hypothetical protein
MNLQNWRVNKIATVAMGIFFFMLIASLHAHDVMAAIKPGIKYAKGNITLEAKQATVTEVLEAIARTAGVDVYTARGFQPSGSRLTFRLSAEPLEDAVKKILHGYNYAAIYAKEGDDFRIVALKIFPDGQQGGEFVPLFSGGRMPVYEEKGRRGEIRTVIVNSGGDVITHGNLQKRGVLIPSQTEIGPLAAQAGSLQTPWFAVKVQLDQQEAEKFQELQMLQKQLDSTNDADRKKALAMVYADEISKFHTMKTANMNKVESLKRITQFRDMSGQ